MTRAARADARRSNPSCIVVSLLLAMLGVTLCSAADEPPLPTLADLKEMYESGAYRTCLQQISRLMQLRPDHPAAVDRGQLALLRGQSLLALEDGPSALRVLQDAQRSNDPNVALPARGLTALIRSSPKLRYVPQSDARGPSTSQDGINIADPKTRRQAFAAYVNDQVQSFLADARKAIEADSLNPSIALVPRMLDLLAAERLATAAGAPDFTGVGASAGDQGIAPVAKQVGEHARELIHRELDLQDRKISNIERVANQLIDVPGGRGWWSHGITRRGLNSDERQSLYDLIQYLQRIVDTAQGALNIAQSVNGDVQAWERVLSRSQAVREHAQNVLDAEGFKSGSGDTSGIGKNG